MGDKSYEWEEGLFRVRKKVGTHLSNSHSGSGLLSGNTIDDFTKTPTGPCELEPVNPQQIKYYLPIEDRTYSKEFQELNYEDRKRIETIRACLEPVGIAFGMWGNHAMDEYIVPGIKKGAKAAGDGIKSLLKKNSKETVEGEIVEPEYQAPAIRPQKKISEYSAKSKVLQLIIYRQKMQSLFAELQDSMVIVDSNQNVYGPDFMNELLESEEELINALPEKTINDITGSINQLERAVRKRRAEKHKALVEQKKKEEK